MPNYRNKQGTGTVETDVFKLGGASITQADHQADSVAADVATLVSDFNALLAKLQSAGIMKSS